ncbi:hypothetical protein QYE76_030843 [Lolium multiflorum]|uniref:Uncharacterized protein n=1 Tax=Lolium multiflorum TaxID=4521 RepID=A0AAD8QQK8_LOLMU|nr:hypothetical protein QYE76_030843 [Lolium multiflorum]
MGPPATPRRERIYVTVAVAQMFWDAGVPMPWGDVHLPHGWHLSPDRVPVPPIPGSAARHAEIRRRARSCRRTSSRTAHGDASPNRDLWFEVEHDARRRTCFTSATRGTLAHLHAGWPPPRRPLHRRAALAQAPHRPGGGGD